MPITSQGRKRSILWPNRANMSVYELRTKVRKRKERVQNLFEDKFTEVELPSVHYRLLIYKLHLEVNICSQTLQNNNHLGLSALLELNTLA